MARRLLLVGAILLVSVISAGAAQTDEDRFLGILKAFGISPGPIGATEKPCLCKESSGNTLVGLLTVERSPGAVAHAYSFECTIPRFNNNTGAFGQQTGCIADGGTMTIID